MAIWYEFKPLRTMVNAERCIPWLDELSVPYTVPIIGRMPSRREILQVIEDMDGVSVNHDAIFPPDSRTGEIYRKKWQWQIGIEGAGEEEALLECIDYNGDEDAPNAFYFDSYSPELVVRITERLSRICGTLVLIDDIAYLLVVAPGTPDNADWYAYMPEIDYAPIEPEESQD